jgi:hypothetical protein
MTETSANALQRGLANRRRVLGDEWVDQSVARANELNVEFQRMIIREVLLQTAVYAGVPAGNTGMAITLKVLKELGRTPAPASFHPPAEAG